MDRDHDVTPVLLSSVEILVTWGTSVLHVAHLTPPRSFYVGDSWALPCDVALSQDVLGVRRAPVVLVNRGEVRLVVLPGATGTVTPSGQAGVPLRAWIDRSGGCRHEGIRGAYEAVLPPGARATFEIGGIAFEVVHGRASGAPSGILRGKGGVQRSMVFAAALHLALLGAAAVAMPPLGEVEESSTDSQQYIFRSFVVSPGDVDDDPEPEPTTAAAAGSEPDGRERADSRCGEVKGGSMGQPTAADTGRTHGVAGPADNPDPHLARESYSSGPPFVSMIGLDPRWSGDPDAPTMPWGRDDVLGNDKHSARGNMWGDVIGASFGSPGIGVGRRTLCPTCGGYGRGAPGDPSTSIGGGATGTESAAALLEQD